MSSAEGSNQSSNAGSPLPQQQEALEELNSLLNEVVELAKIAMGHFDVYRRGEISERELASRIREREPRISALKLGAHNLPPLPQSTKDYANACHDIFTTVADMSLWYSETAFKTLSRQNRNQVMQSTMTRFHNEWQEVKAKERTLRTSSL